LVRTFVVHYSEVALKGKNRPEFVRQLRRNISRALFGLEAMVTAKDGRLFVDSAADSREVGWRLSKVFGVAWFAEASVVGQEYQQISEAALSLANLSAGSSFKIEPRRSDKSFEMSSYELATRLGAEVAARTGKQVDLSSPDLTIHIDVIREQALVYSEKVKGGGGLPVGTAGRVVHLFSGGIDSPVAAWLMMKRGCRPIYMHFYLAPTPESVTNSKITKLVKVLSAYGGKSTLILVPFAEYQLATFGRPGELEPSLFRRFMRMTAEALAPRFRAAGVSTWDSLSQAASQTLWNIGAFDEESSLPVLRPLLSYDKEEIIRLAREIGTYELSLEEYRDCCSIISRHPRTRAKAFLVSEYARELGFKELALKSIERSTLFSYNPSSGEAKVKPLAEAMQSAVV
jgi:thiamine biosynthesis protein ThiI